MPRNGRERLQSQLVDIEQALKEARSPDVRELLADLLAGCRRDLDRLSEPAGNGTAPATGAERAAAD